VQANEYQFSPPLVEISDIEADVIKKEVKMGAIGLELSR
jgi:hypothetical protein